MAWKDMVARNVYMREYKRKRVISFNELVRSYKATHPCVDCGVQYPHYVMDFDHVRGEKSKVIRRALTQSFAQMRHQSISVILQEIEKCDLVCSNCHRIRTFTRKKEN